MNIVSLYRMIPAKLGVLLTCAALTAVNMQSDAPSGILISSQAIALNSVNGKIYAVDETRGAVSIIDPAADSSLSVSVGAGPDALAVNSATGRVYVANSADGTVSVLDSSQNKVVATVKAGPHPYVLAVNEATDKVYVTNTFSDIVAVIDGAANTVSMTKLGSADNVAVDPRTNRIFLLGYENPNLRILNGASGAVDKIEVGEHQWGMAVNGATGDVYVTRIGNAELIKLSRDGDSYRKSAVPVGAFPCAVAVNSKTNTVYVSNYGADTVTVINGEKQTAIATVKVGSRPQAIVVDSRANLVYVANTHGHTVTVIDGVTHLVAATPAAGANPYAITASAIAGTSYVTNIGQPPFTAVKLTLESPRKSAK